MSVTIDIQPKNTSLSESPNFVQFSDANFTNLGFRYRLSYLKEDNTVLHQQYLAPNSKLGGASLTDLNYIMKHYVSFYNTYPKGNVIGFDNQAMKFKFLVAAEYLASWSIVDHEYDVIYAELGRTIIKINTLYTPNIGDVIEIDITSVTGGTLETQTEIKNKLSGIRTVMDVVFPGKFTIDVPFPGNSTNTFGTMIKANQERTVDPQYVSSVLTIVKGIPVYDEVYNPSSPRYKNDYSNLLTLTNLLGSNRTIYDYQEVYLNILEMKTDKVKKVVFDTDGKSAYYLASNLSNNKLINMNPNNCTLTFTAGDNTRPFLEGVKEYTISLLNNLNVPIKTFTYKVNRNCSIFKDQLVFVDDMGNIQSVATNLQKSNNIQINKEQHVYHSNYTTNNFLNTRNDYNTTYTLNTDWMSYDEYVYTEQLIRSPYIWYKIDGKTEMKCRITNTDHEVMSSHNVLYRRTINITILK